MDKHATIRRPGHASESRPLGQFVDELPPTVKAVSNETVWQIIARRLAHNPGSWFRVDRLYTTPASPIYSARKAIEEDYSSDLASRLEYAYEEIQVEGEEATRVRVYLRLNLEPETDDTEAEADAEE